MQKCRFICRQIRCSFSRIHLIDQFLILFISILLIQSALAIFFPTPAESDIVNIDIIMRTSVSAIFGYILSGNFIRNTVRPAASSREISASEAKAPTETDDSASSQNSIVTEYLSPENPVLPHSTDPPEETAATNRLQIIIAACIGLFCMIVLIVFRNCYALSTDFRMSTTIVATIAQFRDILSGCIGFLIGCPVSSVKE